MGHNLYRYVAARGKAFEQFPDILIDQGLDDNFLVGLAPFTTLPCSQNTVQLMTSSTVFVCNQSDTPRE
jgi:hypothetical protein